MRYSFDRAVDLTHELHNGMTVYPGDPAPSFVSSSTIQKNGVNLTELTLGSHTGTHIDAPRHYIPDGIGIDQISPTKLIGEAYVADLSSKPIGSGITDVDLRRTLEGKIARDEIAIIYTGCSEHWDEPSIRENYSYLAGSAAEYLASKKVRAVGIDYLSVERFHAPTPVAHKTLLSNGIFIIESLSRETKKFLGKRILLICMPIKLQNGDGAPSRVIAVPIQ
ncbi:MAG TPA: cyclase family protein [Candidatus Bathyarchaeia archaeon]|jgi:arylformamidase|nr:cyclase family protein [Candidatus Bathyarchaeia archaeon]